MGTHMSASNGKRQLLKSKNQNFGFYTDPEYFRHGEPKLYSYSFDEGIPIVQLILSPRQNRSVFGYATLFESGQMQDSSLNDVAKIMRAARQFNGNVYLVSDVETYSELEQELGVRASLPDYASQINWYQKYPETNLIPDEYDWSLVALPHKPSEYKQFLRNIGKYLGETSNPKGKKVLNASALYSDLEKRLDMTFDKTGLPRTIKY